MPLPLSVLSSRGVLRRRRVAPGRQPPEASPLSTEGGPARLRRFARLALVGYVFALLLSSWWGPRAGSSLRLEDLIEFPRWIAGILSAGVLAGGKFALLGFLGVLSVGRGAFSGLAESGTGGRPGPRPALGGEPASSPSKSRLRETLVRRSSVVLFGMGVFIVLSLVERGRLPTFVAGLFPLAGYLMGAWIATTCLKGHRAAWWLLPKLGLLLLLIGAGCAAILFLAVDEESLSFEPPRVTSADKRRLADILEHPTRTDDGCKRLCLSEYDANLLLAMTVPQLLPQGKARIRLDRGAIRGDLSVTTAGSSRWPRWVNLQTTCPAAVTDGQLEVRIEQCRVGRVRVPTVLLDAFSTALSTAILADPDLEPLLAAIRRLRVQPDGVELVYEGGDFGDKVIPSLLARLTQRPDVVETTRLYIRHLVHSAEALPDEDRLAGFLETAFRLAEARSRVGDPVLENRAAVLALAILLGHWRVETLVGPVTDHDLRASARQHVGRVALRGRRDWCQHFFVSAAVAILSNESVSDEVGLLKEELDAGKGGSGFSFSDLLADRAGTLFALAATRDEPSAQRVQARLAAGAAIDEIFPPAADLPEGIADPQFEAEYGGVGGKRYLEVIGEIERRLAACPALR